MEADVAIHTAEKWAASETSCFEQPDKVQFIYSGRLKESDVRRSAPKGRDVQYTLKPSKSYDNELEVSIGKEVRAHPTTKTVAPTARDDFGLGYDTMADMSYEVAEGRPVRAPAPSYHTAQLNTKEWPGIARSDDITNIREKVRTKDRVSSRQIHSEKMKRSHYDSSLEPLHITEHNLPPYLEKMTTHHHHAAERFNPAEFHLKKDQTDSPETGPKTIHQRPSTLIPSLPSSLTSSSNTAQKATHREKTSPMVILEVRDGPTLFYKPANRMVTDAGIEETNGYGSFAQAHGGSYKGPSVYSQESARFLKGAAAGNAMLPKSAPLTSCGAVTTGSPSQLPRAIGLRRPDLSVLKNSSRGSTEKLLTDSVNSVPPSCSGNLSPRQVTPDSRAVSSAPSTQVSSAAVPGPELFVSKTFEHVSAVLTICEADHHATAASLIPEVNCQVTDHTPPQLPQVVSESTTLEPEGFLNTSEIIQQRAGIKHDDIVVGPRRHLSSGSGSEDIVFEQFVCEVPSIDKPYLPPPKPVSGIPQSDRRQRNKAPDHLVFQEQNLKGTQIKSEVKAVRSQEILSADTEAKRSNSVESGPTTSADNSLERMTSVGGSLDRGRWRPKEKKSSVQRPVRGKADFGYNPDKTKSHGSEVTSKVPGTTEQFGRYSKLSVDTKSLSKSGSSSPARLKQIPSPGSSGYNKTKIPTTSLAPAKKQQQLPPPPSSRLHMLSNIPVPMNHDPPARRAASQQQKVHSSPQTCVEDPHKSLEDRSLSNSSYSANDAVKPITESVDNSQSSFSTSQPVPLPMKGHNSQTEIPPDSASIKFDVGSSSLADSPPSLSNTPTTARKKIPVLQKKDTQSSKQVQSKASIINESDDADTISTAPVGCQLKNAESCPAQDKSSEAVIPDNQPQTPPAKPRLHRSAEHLVGDAKLTVFNSTDNIQIFDNSGTGSKSFHDSEKVDRVGQLKKDKNLAKLGILRRGSDRTEMYRRGSDRGIPICRNDPSVEDLKKATSLKELCQSVASLLNIDNEKAAEMITTSLSQRQDLVEGLDADAILDYLSHHGVLDPAILVGLDKGATPKQRNSTIIRHVEEHGTTAVALFINALRQSGQLHLASSLDTEQRIKPVSGDGYFGKERHKGEVTVRVELEALKILAPREPRTDKIVDTSLLSSPTRHTGTIPDARAFRKDDMEDEDFVKPKSCWCFCFSRKSKAKKTAQALKKESEKNKLDALKESEALQDSPLANTVRVSGHEEVERKNPNVKPHRTKSKEKSKKDSGTKLSSVECLSNDDGKPKDITSKKAKNKSKSKNSGKYSAPNNNATDQPIFPEVASTTDQPGMVFDGANNSDHGDPFIADNHISQQAYNGVSSKSSSTVGKKPDKDNWDPIVMEYDPKLQLVKLRAGQEELASPTRQYGQMGMICEQWKSSGRHYLQKASLLCNSIIQELHTEIIKYFEQDRSTLVLDVISDGTAILIINICMKKAQVVRLQQEVEDGSLITKMEDMFFSKVDITSFDIRGVKLKIVLDDQQVNTALLELS